MEEFAIIVFFAKIDGKAKKMYKIMSKHIRNTKFIQEHNIFGSLEEAIKDVSNANRIWPLLHFRVVEFPSLNLVCCISCNDCSSK